MTTTTQPPAIRVRNLVQRFPVPSGWRGMFKERPMVTALKGVNLDVPVGTIFGILGPNGAGKTTLIKVLSTLLVPTEGYAEVGGINVAKDPDAVRNKIGVVYGDSRTFYWRLSLRENLRFYAALYGVPAADQQRRVSEVLELVDLTNAADRAMHSYSSGMKQRSTIARGLLTDPEILFLDEPTTAVDPIHTHEIRELIRHELLADQKRTIILTTNVMDEAEALCDHIALISQGTVIAQETVPDLRRLYQKDDIYHVELGSMQEALRRTVASVEGVMSAEWQPGIGARHVLRVQVHQGTNAVPAVMRLLANSGCDIWSCVRQELSLDEIFRLMFGKAAAEPTPALTKEAS